MKENINTALLVLITLMVGYDVFLKDEPVSYQNERNKPAVQSLPPTAQMPPQPGMENATATLNNADPNAMADPNLQPNTNPPTKIQFAETNYNFGTIKQDTENKKVFKFKNVGDKPLIIESARGSCGCTVPNYPKQPIPPGQEGEIEVVYSPGKQAGNQSKSVTIIANTEPRTTVLQISAQVES